MPRAQSWREVRLGMAALACIVAAAVAVLAFARVGALHGRTMRLYAATPHARGILPGSEVWLSGQRIGLVKAVGFRPPSVDTSRRVLLALDVLADAAPRIRRDAPVSIRAGGSFIGAPVVAISPASPSAPAVREGDTLVAQVSEFESARVQITTAVGQEVPLILDNLHVLALQLSTARGTLGALGIEGPDRMGATADRAGRLLDRTLHGTGTVSLTLAGGDLTAQANRAIANAGALRAALTNPATGVGRARTDSAFARTARDVQTELARVQALLDEPRGTAGRVVRDSALRQEVARTRAELSLLLEDARRHPLRFVNP